ncbi:MAG: malto-oligosyltrehalose synthase [Burkholderiaceae bacterium]
MSARPAQAIVPRATYRVQLHRDFRFDQARSIVPYLAALGISHLYCSPPLRSRPGSQHGYDVTDHGEINPELGGRAGLDALVATLHEHGMGLLVDIVPNHMGVLGGDNAWWLDVLENGEASAYAEHFDIAWHPADPVLEGRVLLPILGDQYGVVLERGELQLALDPVRGYFTINYHEHRLPIDPAGYGELLRRGLRGAPGASAGGAGAELERLAAAFTRLPPHGSADGAARRLRQREKTALKARLAQCLGERPGLVEAIQRMVAALNGQVGSRSSFDALDALISAQAYRLAHWRIAGDEINYRRFFDINELAALRMDRPEVFEDTHKLVLELAVSGAIDGLRIDHPHGLADPAGYFLRLQQRYAELAGLPAPQSIDGARPATLPLYVVIEKIVAPHEQMPRDWAVQGTTGYRFANVINGVMIDTAAKARLDRVWRAFAGDEVETFDELAWRGRHLVMEGSLAGELTVLATALLRLARADRRTRDFTLNSLRRALADVVASFPVYRTYVVDKPSPQDRRFIAWAIGRGQRRSLGSDASVFEFLRRVLLGRPLAGAPAELLTGYRSFTQRFQQYTAPVAAKGIEDTALYRHHRLISVNDVGGDPDAFGVTVSAFHGASRDRALHWPQTMLASSTHDAKRSEDVRARIDVISEMPAAWRLTVRRWGRLNRGHRRTVDGAPAPSRNDEYLLYQRLIGSLPPGKLDDAALATYADRVAQATLKAARESKAMTSWINPHADYEAALTGFVHALLTRRDNALFLDDLIANAAVFAWYGALNGITMAAVKTLSPGVPDFYQGCELIDLSMVDPDNRRPVDFERRRTLLAEMRELAAQAERGPALRGLLGQASDGRAKFWATWRALQWRRSNEALLRNADYLPLEVSGEKARHVVAFARRDGPRALVVIGTRLFASLGLQVGEPPIGGAWGDTRVHWPAGETVPDDGFLDTIGGRRHALDETGGWPLAHVLGDFPVAALSGGTSAGT